MKNILLAAMALLSISAQAKKTKPEPAFNKKRFTALLGTGYPNVYKYNQRGSLTPIVAGVDYQASHRWSFGLQYSFHYSRSKIRKGYDYVQMGTTFTRADSFQYQQTTMVHTIMVTADYCYLNRGRVSLNSGLGLGYLPLQSTTTRFLDNETHSRGIGTNTFLPIAFRVRLLNAKVKLTKDLGVYCGINYGVDGFFLVGAHYTFTGKK